MGSMGSASEPSIHSVRPLTPVVPQLYELSTIDQYVPKRWVTRMLYFALPNDAVAEEVFESLKLSLSHVIGLYPQITGKVTRQPDKSHWVAVQTEPDGAVRFTFRDHSKTSGLRLPPYHQLKEQGYPFQGVVTLVCPDIMHFEVSEGSSIFAAQANFVEGGLVLTTVFNHVLVDAGWMDELFKVWSKCNAAVHSGTDVAVKAPGPRMDIVKQLSAGSSDKSGIDPTTWVVGDSAKSTFYMASPNTPASSVVHPKKQDENVPKAPVGSNFALWTISSEKQKTLKELAKAWSTIDAVYAFIWHKNASNAKLVARGLATAYARVPIDMRARLTPPIDSSYMGNTVAMLTTEIPSDVVEAEQSQSLPLIARKLRASIQSYSASNFLSFIGAANELPADKAMVYPFPAVFDPCILLNDHSKMKLYAFDWGGHMGHAERLRDVMDDVPVRHLSLALLMPKLVNGALEVVTFLDKDVTEALQADAGFLEYFQYRGNGQTWV